MYLRKWSPVKYLMYLWLAILVWIFCRCDSAATMHLAPPAYHSSGLPGAPGGHPSFSISSSSISSSSGSGSDRYVSGSSRTTTSVSSPLVPEVATREPFGGVWGLSGGPIPPRLAEDSGLRAGPPELTESSNAIAKETRVPAGGESSQFLPTIDGSSIMRQLEGPSEADRALQVRWSAQMRQKTERRRWHRRRWRAGNRSRRESSLPVGGGYSARASYGSPVQQQQQSLGWSTGRVGQRRSPGPSATPSGAPRRYCSARDPATLAFEAPIVCEAKVKSMSDRRPIFAATFEILALHKLPGKGRPLRGTTVRLQFNLTTTNDCDIFRGKFRERGFVREELELGKVYFLFLKPNARYTNFTILGQPIRKTKRTETGVLKGVSPNYGTRPTIHSITPNVTRVEGKRVRLVCRVDGQPPPKVAWFKDKRLISRNATRYTQVHRKMRSELIISNTSTADSGEYECRAKNRYNNSSASNSTFVKITLPKGIVRTEYSRSCTDRHQKFFCHNGGTCLKFDSLDEMACSCPKGYSGFRCESKDSDFQPTSSNKPQDCTSQRYAGYYC
ncbi:protein vein [Anopheles bellator]|uniref:protein vein n=1 Tax=Anopheles bellator TaxID=139047 RepID=UPI002648D021|nr:protein vein [Anopheles bellator]